jgi:WD40 repeat protein
MTSHRCRKCGREWDATAAAENEYLCTKRCGGALEPVESTPQPTATPSLPLLTELPSVLAIPLRDYAAETHPVMRLYRLCDAAEIVTRFCAITAVGELRHWLGDKPLPDELLNVLHPQIERPTFGQWCNMLDALSRALARSGPLVLPQARDWVDQRWLPTLPDLIKLRNALVHGGGMTRSLAYEYLQEWEPWLHRRIEQLGFLTDVELCFLTRGAALRLRGPSTVPEEIDLDGDFREAVHPLDGHVVLLHQRQWLDLWPLCEYGRAATVSLQGRREAAADSPLVYFRAERDRLLYAALGVDLPYGERTDALEEFRTLFRLSVHMRPRAYAISDFEEEIRLDAAAMIGRVDEVRRAKEVIKQTAAGVLWISGPGGIGKSLLLARLAADLGNDPARVWRIAWRFKISDAARCNRAAFFHHAVGRLAGWLGKDQTPAEDPGELYTQLRQLLQAEDDMQREQGSTRARRLLFVVDGLDEIERLDPSFPGVPFLLSHPGVIWLCAGRPEGTLPETFSADRCRHVFPGGLPAMSTADIRGMLLDGTGSLKYQLLPLDSERANAENGVEVVNSSVEAVVQRAQGLPLYVHFVVQDILAGHLSFEELPRRLPPSLSAYYDYLLHRMSIGELQALLTPLLVTIAWARAPLDEATLHLLMVRRTVLQDDEHGLGNLRRGLAAVQSMIRLAPSPNGGYGYEPYHPTFREYIQADAAGIIGGQNALAKEDLGRLAKDWATLPQEHPARQYTLRHGIRHQLDLEHWGDVEQQLTDLFFLESKTEAGLVFDLAADLTVATQRMPADRRKRRILELTEEAIRADIHFIARHPTTLFQCLWNTCWWYDCPDAAAHYVPGDATAPPPSEQPGEALHQLLEKWREVKETASPRFRWLRSRRPPPVQLGTAQRRVLRGHEDDVTSVVISADGHCIVSGSRDNTVRVWDAESGAELHVLRGHKRLVTSVAISPDGQWIVSGSDDNTARVWDAVSGAELRVLRGHERVVTSVEISADGQRIVTGSDDRTARVWESMSSVELHALRGHESGVTSVAISANGQLIVTGSFDKTVRIWNAVTGAELRVLRGHENRVSVAISPDGQRIVSGSTDHTVRVWDTVTGAELHVLRHATWVTSVAINANGQRIISGSDKAVLVWDAMSDAERRVLRGHDSDVNDVAITADGQRIVSGSDDNTVRVWDTTGGADLRMQRGHEDFLMSVAISRDGQRIVTGSADKTVRVWDAVNGTELRVLRGHGERVGSVLITPDGQHIVSGSGDRTVRVWDAVSGAELCVLRGHEGYVRSVVISADGQRIVSGSRDNTVRVWNAVSGAELCVLRGHEGWVESVAISADGQRIVSGSNDKTVRVWDAATGAELRVLRGHDFVESVALNADGSRIASGWRDKTVRVWDAVNGAELAVLRGHESWVTQLSFSPDGRRIVSGEALRSKTVRVWDIASGKCLDERRGRGDVYAIAAGASIFPLRALGRDLETVIEDARTGEPVAWFPVTPDDIASLPDGRTWTMWADFGSHLNIITMEGAGDS